MVKSSTSGETHRAVSVATKSCHHVPAYDWKKNLMLCKHITAVKLCRKYITWEPLAPAYNNFNFFKIDVNVIKLDSPNGSKTTTAFEKNEIDDIHVVDNISDGFDEISMKYFPKKTSCRELK